MIDLLDNLIFYKFVLLLSIQDVLLEKTASHTSRENTTQKNVALFKKSFDFSTVSCTKYATLQLKKRKSCAKYTETRKSFFLLRISMEIHSHFVVVSY